ncbi:hypothetical protein [Streptomyces sp. NPDC014894]|uniref:hypothetical protein n=1 Tax=Streptomyces sp. NPDC014894 TaxID=3364931 RepID=UPI003703099B
MTSAPHRGLFSRLRRFLGGGRSEAFQPFPGLPVDVPEKVTVHRGSLVSFTTPSKGDGYAFQVDIHCDWCAEGRFDRETLTYAIDEYESTMPQRLEELVRDVARGFDPFRVEAAEHAVNKELGKGGCIAEGMVSCRSIARLQPAPEVLEWQRTAARDLHAIEHRYAKSALQVRLLSRTAEQWRTFLAEGLVDTPQSQDTLSWLTPWAVLLADQPDKAASEVGEMFRQRRQQVDDFVKIVEGQTNRYQAHDLFDFVATNERNLGHAMRVFGLPLPGEPDPGSVQPGPLPRPRPAQD